MLRVVIIHSSAQLATFNAWERTQPQLWCLVVEHTQRHQLNKLFLTQLLFLIAMVCFLKGCFFVLFFFCDFVVLILVMMLGNYKGWNIKNDGSHAQCSGAIKSTTTGVIWKDCILAASQGCDSGVSWDSVNNICNIHAYGECDTVSSANNYYTFVWTGSNPFFCFFLFAFFTKKKKRNNKVHHFSIHCSGPAPGYAPTISVENVPNRRTGATSTVVSITDPDNCHEALATGFNWYFYVTYGEVINGVNQAESGHSGYVNNEHDNVYYGHTVSVSFSLGPGTYWFVAQAYTVDALTDVIGGLGPESDAVTITVS